MKETGIKKTLKEVADMLKENTIIIIDDCMGKFWNDIIPGVVKPVQTPVVVIEIKETKIAAPVIDNSLQLF